MMPNWDQLFGQAWRAQDAEGYRQEAVALAGVWADVADVLTANARAGGDPVTVAALDYLEGFLDSGRAFVAEEFPAEAYIAILIMMNAAVIVLHLKARQGEPVTDGGAAHFLTRLAIMAAALAADSATWQATEK